MELLTAAQMRAIEQAAIESGAVTGLELMERAGRGVVEAIFEEWPELARVRRDEGALPPMPEASPPELYSQDEGERRAVVLCGPGNNGGDGFVVARLLKARGWEVEVFLYGDPERLPPDARVNYERWCGTGACRSASDVENDGDFYDLVDAGVTLFIDALFGIGLTRPLELDRPGEADQGEDPDEGYTTCLCQWLTLPNTWDDGTDGAVKSVSIDMPSGLCGDSGQVLGGEGFGVDLTVTFHGLKVGHLLKSGPAKCGKVRTVDIGLEKGHGPWIGPSGLRDVMPISKAITEAGSQVHPAAALQKPLYAHKYTHGHALILSGPMGRSGAARLAARGALRVGAGLVTVAAPGSAMLECATQLTAIMLRKCDGAEGLASLLEDARLNAVCLGPGIGVSPETRDLVAVALGAGRDGGPKRHPMRSVVLDADALTAFADDPQALFDMLHPDAVLTPHAGEFARLFPDIAETLNAPATTGPAYSKVDATRDAAKRAGCIVLFKGPDTVIANPSGRCSINAAVYDRAAPWLATAGTGDVLAGMITGLLARGLAPLQAAETAAWLHTEAARKFGPGLIAEDLPETLPQVFRDLGL